MIGRDAEIAAVRDAVAAATPALVTGEAGIGKSALLAAVASRFEGPAHTGGALATLATVPYLAFDRAFGSELPASDAPWLATEIVERVGDGLLLIDDVQWAHPASTEMLKMLAGRVALVVAMRTSTPAARETATALSAAGFLEVELAPLNNHEAAAVARGVHATLSDGAIDQLVSRAGGNPLLIEQLGTGETVERDLAARLRPLSDPALRGLQLLALADDALSPDEVGGPEVTRELHDARLVAHRDNGVAVRHALIADAAIATLDAETTPRLHQHLASITASPGTRARHLAAAGDKAGARVAALAAADTTAWPSERAAYLHLAADGADEMKRDELLLEAARAYEDAGDFPAAMAAARAVAGIDPKAEVRRHLTLARCGPSAGEPEVAQQAVDEGLKLVAEVGDSKLEGELRLQDAAIAWLFRGDAAAALEKAQAAWPLVKDDPVAAVAGHAALGNQLLMAEQPGWEDHFRAAIDGARAHAAATSELTALANLSIGLNLNDRAPEGRAVALEGLTRAADLRQRGFEWKFRTLLMQLDSWDGDLVGVTATAKELLAEPLPAAVRRSALLTSTWALAHLGRFEDAEAIIDREAAVAAPGWSGQGSWLIRRTELEVLAGRPEAALAAGQRFLDLDVPGHEFDHEVQVSRAMAAMDLGNATEVVDGRFREVGESGYAGILGWVKLLADDEPTQARELFDGEARQVGLTPIRGYVIYKWAAAEASLAAGDTADAIARLEALESLTDERNMTPMLGRIRRSLRKAGVRRSAPRADGDVLTAREAEVLELVGRGLTNKEIAARLGVSARTVQTQVAAAARKLGASNRTHAASLAAQRLR